MSELSIVEISKEALRNNIQQIRTLVGPNRILCSCVKANAYGHGLVETSKIFLESGANWLSVNALFEAKALREAMIGNPIYIMGYVPLSDLEEAAVLDCRLVVYNKETIEKLGEITNKMKQPVKVHIKLETGNNRQGILQNELLEFVNYSKKFKFIEIEGLATHFANIEDTTDHSYAEKQLNIFKESIDMMQKNGIEIPIKHCANSAATILFPETYFDMVRPGISCYGMWPSTETYISYVKKGGGEFSLTPAFSWKTKIAQIKIVPAGEYIGYGCGFRTTHETRLAILPVGYYDGYDRGVNGGHVLIRGKRAPVRGRVCMNIIMVEITDIPDARVEDEVILIGKDGDEQITAEQFGQWAGTINYEVTTRVNERISRIFV